MLSMKKLSAMNPKVLKQIHKDKAKAFKAIHGGGVKSQEVVNVGILITQRKTEDLYKIW